MKVRIILRAKNPFGTTKAGEILTLYNDVFDAMTGIAFYPIDRSQWTLVGYDLFTGVKDREGKEIYCNDKIKIEDVKTWTSKDNPENIGIVKLNEGIFKSEGTYIEYNIGSWRKNIEVIGNIYEIVKF